jgi:pimeloyl-ACP methyl ester carboxylesterase
LLIGLTSAWAEPPPAPECAISQGAVRLQDGTLQYREAGQGPTVLLLHGLFAQKEQWDGFLCQLAAAGRHALAPDLPGYGESVGFPLAVYPVAIQAERLRELVEHLEIESLDIAGNSMGGAIAADYAARYPEGVRTLAFIGPPLGATDWSDGVKAAIRSGINPFIPLDTAQFELEIDLLFAQPPEIPETLRAAAIADYRQRLTHYRQVWDIVNLDARPLAGRQTSQPPIFILWGEHDGIFDVSGAPAFQARLPGSRLEILPATGHLPMLERPTESAALYLDFLAHRDARPDLSDHLAR